MKKIYVVVDTDKNRAVRAFKDEARADEFADSLWFEKNIDARVDEVWFDEVEENED
jgi:hypothetical protein